MIKPLSPPPALRPAPILKQAEEPWSVGETTSIVWGLSLRHLFYYCVGECRNSSYAVGLVPATAQNPSLVTNDVA